MKQLLKQLESVRKQLLQLVDKVDRMKEKVEGMIQE